MEKPEIAAGLKQAIERGYSLEQAKQSFFNAGYNPQDIEDSSKMLTGITAKIPFTTNISQISQPANQQVSVATQQKQAINQPKKGRWLVVLIIILMLIFLTLLGALLGLMFYPNNTKEIITKILPFIKT